MTHSPKSQKIQRPAWNLSNLAMCLSLALAGCGRDDMSAEQHLQKAKEFVGQGKPAEAQIELRNAIQKEPTNSEAYILQAEMYLKVGNPLLAETSLRKARESGVPIEATKPEMARALMMQGKPDEALREAQMSANDSKASQARLLDAQSLIYLSTGRVDLSCQRVDESMAAQPDSVIVLQGRARCALARDKDAAKAETLLRQALEKDKNNAETLSQLGRLMHASNKPTEAVVFFRQSLAVDPLQLSSRITLANELIKAGKFDDARALVQQGLKIVANPGLAELQAHIEFLTGNYAKARDMLAKLLRDYPDYMPAVLLNGLTTYMLGNDEQATKDLSRYLALNPDHLLARRTLAATQLRDGQVDLVLGTLEPLVTGEKPDAEALGLLGQSYLAKGEYAKAISALQNAIRLDVKTQMPQILLGTSLLAQGNEEKGAAILAEAAAKEPKSTQAESVLVAHYMSKESFDKALSVIAAMDKKRPNDPSVLNQRGLAYVGKKDYAKARAEFTRAYEINPAYYPAASGLARVDILQNKDFKSARQRFESLLAKEKGNFQAQMALASLAKAQNQPKEHEALLKKAAETNRNSIEPKFGLWQLYSSRQEFGKAREVANEAATLFPNSPLALDMLAKAQLSLGDKENAVASYYKLIKISPSNSRAHFELGLLLASQKKLVPAREMLTKAVRLSPNDTDTVEALVMLMLSQGQSNEAMQVVRKFQQVKPGGGYALEGDIQFRQKNYKEAAQAYGKAYAVEKSDKTLIRIHQARVLAGDAQGADQQLLGILAGNPKNAVLRSQLAKSLAFRNAYQDAIRQYEMLLADNPNNPFALNDLAWLYGKVKDPRAVATAERALQSQAGNPAFLDTLGYLLLQSGQNSKAIEALEKAAKVSSNPMIRVHYAQALLKGADQGKARQLLTEVVKSYPASEAAKEANALLGQVR